LPVIIAGDFNSILDPSIDRSGNPGNKPIWQSTLTIKQFMTDYGLADSWRLQHPSSREYSFITPVHHSYSRLDFFLTSNSMISNISQSSIHPIIISDHAPVTINWTMTHTHKTTPRWRLNTSLLQDSKFDALIKKEWAFFLEMNDSPGLSSSLLWETELGIIYLQIHLQ